MVSEKFLMPFFAVAVLRNTDKRYLVIVFIFLYQLLNVGDFAATGCTPCCPNVDIDQFPAENGRQSTSMSLWIYQFRIARKAFTLLHFGCPRPCRSEYLLPDFGGMLQLRFKLVENTRKGFFVNPERHKHPSEIPIHGLFVSKIRQRTVDQLILIFKNLHDIVGTGLPWKA